MKNKLRKVLPAVFVLALVALPLSVSAATYVAKDTYTLGTDEVVEGNVYAGGTTITINGTVEGDFIAAGSTLSLNGEMQDDVLAAGGTITMTGTINDDFRAVGGTISISGTINGDVNVAGGQVTFDKNSVVTGDLTVAAGTVTLAGRVDQNVGIGSGDVTLSGAVNGNVEATVESLTITEEANITGNLTYRSSQEGTISSAATIGGTTTFTKHTTEKIGAYFGLVGLGIAGFFFNLIGTFIILLLLVLLLKGLTQKIENEATQNFWKTFLIGLLILVATPIIGILLFITIIGIPLAMLLFILYFLMIALGAMYANLLVGSYVLRWIQKKDKLEMDWKVALLGVVVLSAVALVPFVGWIVAFVFFLAGLGAVSITFYSLFGEKK